MENLLAEFNKQRKASKGKWLMFGGEHDGFPLAIKSFDTWIQVADHKGKRGGGPMDCTVKVMNEWLTKFLED